MAAKAGEAFRSPKEAEDALTLFVEEAAKLCKELKSLLHQHHTVEETSAEIVALTSQVSFGAPRSPCPPSPGVGSRIPGNSVQAPSRKPQTSRHASPKHQVPSLADVCKTSTQREMSPTMNGSRDLGEDAKVSRTQTLRLCRADWSPPRPKERVVPERRASFQTNLKAAQRGERGAVGSNCKPSPSHGRSWSLAIRAGEEASPVPNSPTVGVGCRVNRPPTDHARSSSWSRRPGEGSAVAPSPNTMTAGCPVNRPCLDQAGACSSTRRAAEEGSAAPSSPSAMVNCCRVNRTPPDLSKFSSLTGRAAEEASTVSNFSPVGVTSACCTQARSSSSTRRAGEEGSVAVVVVNGSVAWPKPTGNLRTHSATQKCQRRGSRCDSQRVKSRDEPSVTDTKWDVGEPESLATARPVTEVLEKTGSVVSNQNITPTSNTALRPRSDSLEHCEEVSTELPPPLGDEVEVVSVQPVSVESPDGCSLVSVAGGSCGGQRRQVRKTRRNIRSPSRSLSQDSYAPSNPSAESALQRNAASPGRSARSSRTPVPRGHTLWQLFQASFSEQEVFSFVEELLLASLPRCNVAELVVKQLNCEHSTERFLRAVGDHWCRVRVAWHLARSSEAARSIVAEGIRCDEAHCKVGRYGRGGYVALSAAKANAYADSSVDSLRHLFLVLVLPEGVVQGERGTRPSSTAADLPSHPTEYCFVDPSRLHCACLLTYRWVKTARRSPCQASPRLPPPLSR
uniref:Uncharacterized protein n=1 Tax=Noctiluca scintillans TaxID=2966 RepID=A0A7S1B191_NOCSC